jgi:cell division protein FtsL
MSREYDDSSMTVPDKVFLAGLTVILLVVLVGIVLSYFGG